MDIPDTKITIKYNWKCNDGSVKELSADCLEYLEAHAEERIFAMRKEGYTCGELHTFFEIDDTDVSFSGWWSLTTEKV